MARLALRDRHLWRVSGDWYRLDGGGNRREGSAALPEARWNAYRRAFRVLDLETGATNLHNGVLLHRHSEGFLDTGLSKGFAFLTAAPDPKLESPSLDFDPWKLPPAETYGIRYRHLDGPWYLYLEWYR